MLLCVCLQVTSLLNRLANVSTDNLPHYLLIHGTGDGTAWDDVCIFNCNVFRQCSLSKHCPTHLCVDGERDSIPADG